MSSLKELNKSVVDKLKGCVIGIEGIIGVGKSTFALSIVEYLKRLGIKVKLYKEYVNYTLLKQYLNNMTRHSYMYQIVSFFKRSETFKKALIYAQSGGVSIIDRTSIGDFAFALMQKEQGNISEEEWIIYNKVIKEESTIKPSLIVDLDVDPKVAFERMKNRGNKDEISGYTLKYFDLLKKSYKKTYKLTNHNIITFDWKDNNNVNSEGKLTDNICKHSINRILNVINK